MTTLTPFLDRYFVGRRKRGEIDATTARKQRRKMVGLDESFGCRPVGQFGAAAIDRWMETIGHLAPSSRRQYLSIARGFGRWMLAQGEIRRDPTAHVPRIYQPRKAPVTLTRAEVAQIFATCPDRRTAAVVWLMVGSGCRTVEVARMRVEDYDPRAREVRCVGKAGNERIVPVPRLAAQALNAYLDEVGRVAGPLIRSERTGQHMLPSSIGRLVRDTIIAAGVKARPLDGRSPHGLRRTAASDVLEECGGDIQLVQEMLGHASIETTARHYLRRVPMERLRQAMEGRAYDGSESGEEDRSPPFLRAA